MSDKPERSHDQPKPSPSVRLDYGSPATTPKSQWLTDDQPGGNWLVGCLIVLSAGSVVLGAVFGLVFLMLGC